MLTGTIFSSTKSHRLILTILFLSLGGCSGLLFQPQKKLVRTPTDIGINYIDVNLEAADGTTLHGWWLEAKGPPKGSVYFLHGNAENISTHITSVYWLPAAGYQVLLLDYRGFGKSRGAPGIPAVFMDIKAGFEWLIAHPDAHGKPIFLFGQSLGAAMGSYLAATDNDMRQALNGVVLESGFTRYRTAVKDVTSQHWLTRAFRWPVIWTMPRKYDPLDYIASISPHPLLLLHGTRDEIIPLRRAEELFAAARQPKSLLNYDGPHIGAMTDPVLRQALTDFMQEHSANRAP